MRAAKLKIGVPANTGCPNFPEILAKACAYFHLNLLIFLTAMLKTSYFFLNIVHKVKA